ncbi:SDR family oxidoreductase [Leeia aquatica]|uniref:SDR family oxidoreductase n=1 Tax=Leeia aquatica TaxID=2725557 RepID=A0A847SCN0_9NEIS|nr:SDR family oxidoreductase [Leeia aquatica]NLR75099.1 SDR family oxidoreductase [Leeia aquatica]
MMNPTRSATPDEMMPVALLSGAASPWPALAEALLQAGYRLVWHSPLPLPPALAAAPASRVCRVQADVHSEATAQALLREVQQLWRRLDVLLLQPPQRPGLPLPEAVELELAQRLGPLLALTQAAVPLLREQQGVVLWWLDQAVSRSHWLDGAVQAALPATLRALAAELAPDVRLNAIQYPAAQLREGELNELAHKRMVQKVAMKRPLREADLVQAMHYLLQADFVTGHLLPVDGGGSVG